jgi:quercetin dioxygenase-like cupin family protein
MSRFVTQSDLKRDRFDWGEVGWRCRPDVTGAKQLTVMDVTLAPGKGHAFHKHPDQEEMIIVKSGRIEQWLEQEKQELGPGDSVYIDAGVVHASFTVGSDDASLQVVLSPARGEIGYEIVDVFEDEPWRSLRA